MVWFSILHVTQYNVYKHYFPSSSTNNSGTGIKIIHKKKNKCRKNEIYTQSVVYSNVETVLRMC